MSYSEIVRRYVVGMNHGDWPAVRELFARHAEVRGVLGWGSVDVAMPIWRELRDGMKMVLEIEGLVESGETVVARYTERGRFVGSFRGLPGVEPTGREYEVVAMEWFEFHGGKIGKRWGARDFDRIKTQVLAARA